ncbi:MAG: prepilin-type N-terminal cleavage/methylation domain-containing protein [Armatimonadetes bacterium]|nr:prepilin-type N-terminal cleavage/methylation domain-containing protein [Armatimonadota bacterium]
MNRRAFTLIELLVVIAIIAILAAILFPVFAQAKEAAKKTQSLSNVKQTALSILIYTGDHDDNFPDAYGHDTDGTTLYYVYNGYPAGWDDAAYEQRDSTAWGNSIQPYMKNSQLLEIPGFPTTQVPDFSPASYANPRKQPQKTALTMNGLLSIYNAGAVAQPSRNVLLWYGFGKENDLGAVNMNPALICDATGPEVCRFNPSGMPQGSQSGTRGDVMWSPVNDGNDSVWHFGHGMNMARSDSSAKYYQLGGVGTKSSYDDPFGSYGRQGEYWLTTQRCFAGSSTVRYSSFFRPDTEFNYTFGSQGQCFQ